MHDASSKSKQAPTAMIHERKKTLYEEYGMLAKVKVDDFVLVEPCYTPSICSEGCVAMVARR
jgi:hypothetical protein